MTDSVRIVKNTGFLYFKTIVSMFVMLYVTRVVLRSLGAEDYGIYNVVAGVISMLGFFSISMATTVQRFFNNAQGKKDFGLQKTIFNIALVLHVIIGIVVSLFLYVGQFFILESVLNISEYRHYAAICVYQCLIISTFFSIIVVPYDALINSHEDMLAYSILGIIDVFLKLIIAIYVSFSNSDRLITYSILMIAVPLFDFLMMMFYSFKHYDECQINILGSLNKEKADEMLKFAGWNFVGLSSSMIGNYGIGIVLNHFFGALLNAASGIASQLQGMLSVLSAQFLKALNPIIFKLGAVDERGRMMLFSYMGCKYSYLLFFFISVPVVIETPFVLKFWLSYYPDWTVLFVRLILIRALLEQVTYSLKRSLEAVGSVKQYNRTVSAFYLIPLLVLFIIYKMGGQPYWNVIVPLFFMSFIPSVFQLYYCKRYCSFDMKVFVRTVLCPCILVTILSFIAGIIPSSFMDEGWMRLFCCIFFSWVMAGLVFLLTIGKEEKSLFLRLYNAQNSFSGFSR